MSVLKVYHNSYENYYRHPFGAVPCGQQLVLRLDVQGEEEINNCYLHIWENAFGEKIYVMECIQESAGFNTGNVHKTFQVKFISPDTPGLLWYYFKIIAENKIIYYGNSPQAKGGEGILSEEQPRSYQITVYKPTIVPSWFKSGIIYQIYVDRFFNGNENGTINTPRMKSLIYGDWYETPSYFKDNDGRIIFWDFFGGNLKGVIVKLPYLRELGVTIIYFNPIFEAASNHKYDTANYLKIDQMYGDESVFVQLIKEAEALGISIILDGVFSHTGSDSIYFNKYGTYLEKGAFQSTESPYFRWYSFKEYPKVYECWWGVDDLPNVNELEPTYQDFIIKGENSVIRYWMDKGVRGWRLDVADELPDEFIKELKNVTTATNPNSILIGEVWDDASCKISYCKLREYFWGNELDSTMNYPLRSAFIDFILAKADSHDIYTRIMSLFENYPRENFYSQMNILGSHDSIRILTVLGEAPLEAGMTETEKRAYRMSPESKRLAVKRLKILCLLQLTFPGVPCIYYGDEVGLEGYSDPYNRATYPWQREDNEILEWYKRMTKLRKEYDIFNNGEFQPFFLGADIFGFKTKEGYEEIIVLTNRSQTEEVEAILDYNPGLGLTLGPGCENGNSIPENLLVLELLSGSIIYPTEKTTSEMKSLTIKIQPLEGKIIYCKHSELSGRTLQRSCGILLHLTSLPSPWGIGDLGIEAREFVNFLASCGQGLWQILPHNPPGFDYSPYQSFSAFAGNPLLISVEDLIQENLLTKGEVTEELSNYDHKIKKNDESPDHTCDSFLLTGQAKDKLMQLAYARFQQIYEKSEESNGLFCWNHFLVFKEENNYWLDDYSLYSAFKEYYENLPWQKWEKAIALREKKALAGLRHDLEERINYYCFVQYIFFTQWDSLKKYANSRHIKIIGDLPIYVAEDSCDTWVNKHLFSLDETGKTLNAGGVPPDYFSLTGQFWGNPLYHWDLMAKDGYFWWRERIRQALKTVDFIRLDHFRGFEAYWEIQADAVNAVNGHWLKGPGKRFFEALEAEFGDLPFIAEDLGFITPEVNNLKNIFGFPGMKVLQFTKCTEDTDDEEEVTNSNYVYYSGTHDNDTLCSWYQKNSENDNIQTKAESAKICHNYIEKLYRSSAQWIIIPLQDILALGCEARMNIPGTACGNWRWRLDKSLLTTKISRWLTELAEKYERG